MGDNGSFLTTDWGGLSRDGILEDRGLQSRIGSFLLKGVDFRNVSALKMAGKFTHIY